MTPASRLATAIELLDAILEGAPAEASLTNWARGARYAGSKDRAAVRDIVFECLRKKRSFAFAAGGQERGRALVLAYVQHQGDDPSAFFTGQGYAPEAMSREEAQALASDAVAPAPVALDYPDFLHDDLSRSLGGDLQAVMAAMRDRAPVDVRVNLLRGSRDQARAALARDDIEAVPVKTVPTALRLTQNPRKLAGSKAYQDGLVDIQDASSQAVALLAGVEPGQKVLDYCAGGGGKALALFDQGQGHAQIYAHDIATVRMNDLPARAARAGARINVLRPDAAALKPGGFDVVFVDAPCSGTGAWRRSPDAKWRFKPENLEHLRQIQKEILATASQLVSKGGTLVYATCSLLRRENEDQVDEFLLENQIFSEIERLVLTPVNCSDGFFAAKLLRT